MRKLRGTDVFAALRLVKELEIEEQVKLIASAMEQKTYSQKELGIGLLFNVLGNCGSKKAEEMFWELAAGPLEMDPKELSEMEPLEAIEKIKGLSEVIDTEGYKRFFKSLAGLIK